MPFDFRETLDTLDGVPQEFQGLYTPSETGFTFHPDFREHTKGLTSALDKERKAAREAKTALTGWTALGQKPEEVKARMDELAEAASKADGGKALQKLKEDLEKGFGDKLKAKDTELSTMQASVEKYLVDTEATAALAEAKGSVMMLLPHIKSQVRVLNENGNYVVRVVDQDGDPRGNGKGGYMTIKDLVSEMKNSEHFGRGFESTGNTGGGKPSGGTKTAGTAGKTLTSLEKIQLGLNKK